MKTFQIVKTETENFRGKHPAVQILTISCSHIELLHAAPGCKTVAIRILHADPVDAVADIAMVAPLTGQQCSRSR